MKKQGKEIRQAEQTLAELKQAIRAKEAERRSLLTNKAVNSHQMSTLKTLIHFLQRGQTK